MAPVLPQIAVVTSEALQEQIRTLLPSQNGFGTDLCASNVIQPIVDLTTTAAGADFDVDLARALAFGSQTAFNVTNTTSTIINTAGFYRIVGLTSVRSTTGVTVTASVSMTDGLATKIIWQQSVIGATNMESQPIDLIVYLNSGESVTVTSSSVNCVVAGSTRQVADVNGEIVYPNGFTPQ